MTFTLPSSPFPRFGSSKPTKKEQDALPHHSEAAAFAHASDVPGPSSLSGPASETFELTQKPETRKNTPEESARARANLKRFGTQFVQANKLVNKMNTPMRMEHMLGHADPQSLAENLPLRFTPNPHGSADHSYFRSSDLEFDQVLQVLNKRINSDPDVRNSLKATEAADLNMKLFANPGNRLNASYKHLTEKYGDNLFPTLTTLIESGRDGLEERAGHTSAYSKLDGLMGREFTLDAGHEGLQKFLQDHLGFGATQLIENPEDKKIIQDWRVTRASRYALQRATKINSTWAEWGTSALISGAWSFGLDTLGKNGMIASLFKSELKNTDYDKVPGWRKVILGIPEDIYEKIIKKAGVGKRTGTVAIGVTGQGTCEIPDVLLNQGAIQRSGEEGITAWQGFKRAVATKKLSTAMAVITASTGTSFEKAKELIWIPTKVGSKIGYTAVGFVTNGVSILACGQPFFTEGGPQTRETAEMLAKAYNPVTGHLKLTDADRQALINKGTAKGVKEYFENLALKKFIHLNPKGKVLAASIPVALGVSAVPSLINGASTFIPQGLIPEIIKTGMSWGQVIMFGPIELLSFNLIASANRSHPQLVSNLATVGRPVINAVYKPFSVAKRVFSDGVAMARSKQPKNPHQVYQDFLQDLNRTA